MWNPQMHLFFRSSALIVAFMLASTVSAVPVDLGIAGHYTILGAGVTTSTSHYAGNLSLGSEAHVFGSAGGRNVVNVAPSVQVDDDLSGGHINASLDLIVGGTQAVLSEGEWSLIHQDMIDASAEAADLPNQTALSNISGSTVLSSTGSALSVYNVTGAIFLGAADVLTISGSTSDEFVINVDGGMNLASGASIVMSGGARPENVLFNFTGGGFGGPASIIGATTFNGTYLAPYMYFQIGDGAIMDATRILASGIQGNIQDITPPLPIPEPTTAILLGLGLAVMGMKMTKGQRR
ncbi:MAG: ice-binding family protein [Pirellulales bacterium]|nr:ice-binding family protein [Pirellulales bacterium]